MLIVVFIHSPVLQLLYRRVLGCLGPEGQISAELCRPALSRAAWWTGQKSLAQDDPGDVEPPAAGERQAAARTGAHCSRGENKQ